jgi:UDP-N-acetylmuramoyl-tripeptide--D-alanyl-D-alanine ligase
MVETLMALPAGRHLVVAGEMLELGPEGAKLHRDLGEFMAHSKVDFVLGVRGIACQLAEGAAHAGATARFVDTPEEAGDWLASELQPGDAVLLKASRGVRLEKALEVLRARLGERADS